MEGQYCGDYVLDVGKWSDMEPTVILGVGQTGGAVVWIATLDVLLL
jgi:hypothetical protein